MPAWALLIINGIKVLADQLNCFNILDDRIKQLEDLKAVNSNMGLQVEDSAVSYVSIYSLLGVLCLFYANTPGLCQYRQGSLVR